MLFRRALVLFSLALAACAGTTARSADVKSAREARYRGDPAEIFAALAEAVGASYRIAQADPTRLELVTAPSSFGAADAGTISLAYSVVLTPSPPYRVQVLTHLECENGDDPAWVAARTERLILAIHERLSGYEVRVDRAP
jgi:hypothetical protein